MDPLVCIHVNRYARKEAELTGTRSAHIVPQERQMETVCNNNLHVLALTIAVDMKYFAKALKGRTIKYDTQDLRVNQT